jgi:hypothetical protein
MALKVWIESVVGEENRRQAEAEFSKHFDSSINLVGFRKITRVGNSVEYVSPTGQSGHRFFVVNGDGVAAVKRMDAAVSTYAFVGREVSAEVASPFSRIVGFSWRAKKYG